MVDPGPSPDREDPERAEELRALARLLNDETNASEPLPEGTLDASVPSDEPLLDFEQGAVEPELELAPAVPQQSAPAQDDQPQPQGLIADRFQVIGLVGGGPHGAVWRVSDHENQGREVALKILRQEWSHGPRLLIGLQAHLERSHSLTHETINRVRGVGRTGDGRIWLTFDLVQGEDLRELLIRRGALSPRHALEIVRQILLGIEQGHGLGLVHGDLRLDHVILEDRVPWSDDNPYGVGVQILDYGLRPLFEGTRPGRQGDLLAIGRMLAELLTGTRFGADGPQWAGSEASPITAALSNRARQVLDTALDEDPTQRFEDAAEFRQAIESSPEWQSPRSTPWAWVAASVVFVALATVFGLQLLKARGAEVPVYAAEPGGVETVALSDYEDLERELDRQREDSETRAFRMQGELDLVTREVDSLRSSSGELETRATAAESEAERLSSENSQLRGDYDAIVAQLETSRARVSELEALNRPVPNIRDPRYLAAAYLERILDRLQSNDGAGAHATCESFREDTTLREAGIKGSDFLGIWIGAALSWQRLALETNDIERIPLMQRTQAAYAAATDGRLSFEMAAADWLHLEDEEGRPINLSARVNATLENLGTKIEVASEDLSARLSVRWAKLSTSGLEEDPAELIAIASWFGDGRLKRYTASYAETIAERAEPNGVLLLDELRKFDRLPAWAEAITSAPELEFLAGGGEILLYAYAQRFYDDENKAEVLPSIAVHFRNGEDGASGWREELAMRTALLRDDSPFPGPVGTRSLYHSRTPEGLSSWLWQTVQHDEEPPEGTDRSWLVEQQFYDQAGRASGSRTLRVYLRGKRYYEKDVRSSVVIDLGTLVSNDQVRSWAPQATPAMPDNLPVSPGQVARFRDLLETGKWRCLVNANGSATTWYSPELGLLGHDDPGRITRQLVYTEMPR